MCGFVGVFHTQGDAVSHSVIEAMNARLVHRGPDGEGIFLDSNFALGHRRLSVLDLSEAGSQPMINQRGDLVIAYNGEVYNYLPLRRELEAKGYRFQSQTDTEVILHGFDEYGIEFAQRLNGMFAFAIWNKRSRTVYLARDRYGIKPLYFWYDQKTLIFASEIKAILQHPLVSVRLNPNAVNEYFTFQNLFNYDTFFQNIFLMPAANFYWLNQSEQKLQRHCYWDYDFTRHQNGMTFDEAGEETARLLKQAVERQLVSDVPLGSYLSGGMDSSSLVALASSNIPSLPTFTCGYHMHGVDGKEAAYDERREAEVTANALLTEHYEQVISPMDITRSLPKVIHALEELRVGMSYSNYYISRLASKFVKVCLSGNGGDELYAGYPWRYYRVFRCLDREDFFKEYYAYWQRLIPDEDKSTLFTPEFWGQVHERDTYEIFRKVFTFNDKLRYDTPEDHIANSLYFESKTFLQALFLVGDRLSMVNSLEERFPFMDNDLVDWAQQIPIRYKLRNLEDMKRIDENELRKVRKYYIEYDDGKNILRQAMERFIPSEVSRRKKQGFSSPDETWFRGRSLNYLKETLLCERPAYRDYLNQDYVRRIIEDHASGKQNYRLRLWSFLCFEWWCRIFLEKEAV